MRFFIPGAETPEEAEQVYAATKKFAAETMGWEIGDGRIRSITYTDKGKSVRATVGEPEPREGQLVVAILDSNTYLVCTPNRGVIRDMPIMVGKLEVTHVDWFDEL